MTEAAAGDPDQSLPGSNARPLQSLSCLTPLELTNSFRTHILWVNPNVAVRV